MTLLLPLQGCDAFADDAVLPVTGRVLAPAQMAAVVDWFELPAWLSRHGDERLRRRAEDEEARRAEREAAHAEQLALERQAMQEALRAEAERERSAMVAALQAQVFLLAQDMAQAATAAVAEVLQPEDSPGLFQARVLERLVGQLDAQERLVVAVHPDAADEVQRVLGEWPGRSPVSTDLHLQAGLAPTACIVRCGDQMFEADLETWLGEVHAHLQALAAGRGFQEPGASPLDAAGQPAEADLCQDLDGGDGFDAGEPEGDIADERSEPAEWPDDAPLDEAVR